MLIRLLDLPELSPTCFGVDKMCLRNGFGCLAYRENSTGQIVVDDEFWIVGWSRKMDQRVMFGREGQIGLMFYNHEAGEVWQHYPLYDDADYEDAVLETIRGRV